MSVTAMPPRWAEALLRAFLKPDDFESVSGDLLEHYRDSIYPSRGQRGADLWYAMQVLSFVSPGARLFAVLFSAQFLARTTLDWFMPTLDFHIRATVSTVLAVGTVAPCKVQMPYSAEEAIRASSKALPTPRPRAAVVT